jgi:nucleotide-binding universal stress UspA family protein
MQGVRRKERRGPMVTLERILVPLDGSKLSEAVLPAVTQMALAFKASVTLLHVEDPGDAWGGVLDPRYLGRVARSLERKGLQVQVARVTGNAAQEVLGHAREHGASLIAMATHGRSGVNRWVYGSVTEKVVHAADTPLLLVRPEEKEGKVQAPRQPFQSVVVPLDGSKLAEEALPHAEFLASRLGLPITLLRVVPFTAMLYSGFDGYVPDPQLEEVLEGSAREYLEEARARLAQQGFQVTTQMVRGHPPSQIIDIAQGIPGSLIVMSTHGRTGMRRWILGSVADRVLRAAHRPVLLVRPESARIAALEEQEARVAGLA